MRLILLLLGHLLLLGEGAKRIRVCLVHHGWVGHERVRAALHRGKRVLALHLLLLVQHHIGLELLLSHHCHLLHHHIVLELFLLVTHRVWNESVENGRWLGIGGCGAMYLRWLLRLLWLLLVCLGNLGGIRTKWVKAWLLL